MAGEKTATFIKDVSEFFTGSAALFQLVPPFQRPDLDPMGNPYIEVIEYVVAADAMIRGVRIGTTLYQSDDTGYVTSWDRLHETPIVRTREQAMSDIGYTIEGEGDEGRPVQDVRA